MSLNMLGKTELYVIRTPTTWNRHLLFITSNFSITQIRYFIVKCTSLILAINTRLNSNWILEIDGCCSLDICMTISWKTLTHRALTVSQ